MRKTTDFAGWQSEIEYLASESERQKRIERAIELHRRMREDEVRPLVLKWKLTLVFIGIVMGCWIVYLLIDAALRAMGL